MLKDAIRAHQGSDSVYCSWPGPEPMKSRHRYGILLRESPDPIRLGFAVTWLRIEELQLPTIDAVRETNVDLTQLRLTGRTKPTPRSRFLPGLRQPL